MFGYPTRLAVTVLGVVFFVTGFGLAQEAQDIKSLEREVAALRRQLKDTQRQLDEAIAAGFIYTDEGFSSVVEILDALPKELKLNAKNPWDQVKWKDVPELLSQNVIGKPFRCKLVLSKVDVKPNPRHVNDRTQPKFEATLEFQNEKFPQNGFVVLQKVMSSDRRFQFLGDEELVEKAKKLKVGKSYEIGGMIAQLEIRKNQISKQMIDFEIELSRIDFEPMK